jgi:RNA polymerase sigma factor (sigma-70 family)
MFNFYKFISRTAAQLSRAAPKCEYGRICETLHNEGMKKFYKLTVNRGMDHSSPKNVGYLKLSIYRAIKNKFRRIIEQGVKRQVITFSLSPGAALRGHHYAKTFDKHYTSEYSPVQELFHVPSGEPSPHEHASMQEQVNILHNCMHELPEREYGIIKSLFWDGKTLKETSTSYNLTTEGVALIRDKTIEKLRFMMHNEHNKQIS